MRREPTEPPARLDRRGLPGPDERARMVIVLMGVMVGALLLASVLGYVVYHALTEQPRTTVGMSAPVRPQHNTSAQSLAAAFEVLPAHP